MKENNAWIATGMGFLIGFFFMGVVMNMTTVDPLRQEAIKRGYAEYRIPEGADPNQSNVTVFTWK